MCCSLVKSTVARIHKSKPPATAKKNIWISRVPRPAGGGECDVMSARDVTDRWYVALVVNKLYLSHLLSRFDDLDIPCWRLIDYLFSENK